MAHIGAFRHSRHTEGKVATRTKPKRAQSGKLTGATGVDAKGRKASGASDTSVEYANVLAHAVDTFGSKIRADQWLNKPNRLFRYKTPLQTLVTDAASVEEELIRIDHGIYI